MIQGRVRRHEGLHAEIPLRILGQGRAETLTVTIDTGFTDYLVLPNETIQFLRPPVRRETNVLLASDNILDLNVYDAMVELDGETFEIEVYEAEGDPLVGMALLTGFRLDVEVTSGGEVRVEGL